ncbi:MAG: NB-ARC domain-containing protein [Rhodothalassiaceae bacterium]
MRENNQSVFATKGGYAAGREQHFHGSRPTVPLPGPIYSGIPRVPQGYQDSADELAAAKALLLDGVQPAGIVGQARHAGLNGMGGLGKTVLATALCHDPDIRSAFAYGIVWLTFGREATALEKLHELARAVTGMRADYVSVGDAQKDLHRLLEDTRVLLVLDDLWENRQLDAFRDLPHSVRLLVTTRKKTLLDRIGADSHQIGLLKPPADRAFVVQALGVTPKRCLRRRTPSSRNVAGCAWRLPPPWKWCAGMVGRAPPRPSPARGSIPLGRPGCPTPNIRI